VIGLHFAEQHDLAVDRHFVERGISGSVPLDQRPEGKALLAVLRPGDVIIMPKLDRLFRTALNALGMKTRRQPAHDRSRW
jgi:putative DNA-invertase from lambdoid prophage Rac